MPKVKKYKKVKYKYQVGKSKEELATRKAKRILARKNTSRLLANKRMSSYKDEKAYIDAVYRNNKEYIDSHIDQDYVKLHGTPKKAFKALVKEQMSETNYNTGEKYTLQEALKRLSGSKSLNKEWKTSDVKANNFENLLKKDKNVYKEFRNKTREGGKFAKYDYSKLKFEGYYVVNGTNAAVYFYGDTYIIEFKSPTSGTGASIIFMTKFEFEQSLGKDIFEGKVK